MVTIGKRRYVLVLTVIGLIYLILIGVIWKGDAPALREALTAILTFVGGFTAGILNTRPQDETTPPGNDQGDA